MPELSMHLKKLETLPGALDIIRYLDESDTGYADMDDITYDLDMSSRRFGKATRRLVTNGYIQMRSDYVYELTQRGKESARELREYDAAAPDTDDSLLTRPVLLALPRNLVAGQTSPLLLGFPAESDFPGTLDLVLRLEPIYAELGAFNEMAQVGADAFVTETTITPGNRTQARLRLQVFHLKDGGNDLALCGGMYVDVAVLEDGDTGEMIAYSTDITFDSA
jgi:predicted transcriptional regulator